ncbi:hypothetical protein C4D60_Mb03t16290 [Musa balbisiana]|uniref:Uncharacterized protein n=1 Tax=Musa balbisiana TaxID=52838 RepID=A0A4S8JAD6_MUSBA|nr:hypothetical protein C4D60_Mb03t16290 [Musa balbisiana]
MVSNCFFLRNPTSNSKEEAWKCPLKKKYGVFLGEKMVEEEAVRSSWVLAFQAVRKNEEEEEKE